MDKRVHALLGAAGVSKHLRRAREILDPQRREVSRQRQTRLAQLRAKVGTTFASIVRQRPTTDCVLFNAMEDIDSIAVQIPLFVAFRKAGFRPIILLSARSSGWLEEAYRLVGVDDFLYYEDCVERSFNPLASEIIDGVQDVSELLTVMHKDMSVGKYALASFIRVNRNGNPDLGDGTVRLALTQALSTAINFADGVAQMVDGCGATTAVIADRGYSPQGQAFDRILRRGGVCFSWNSFFRSGILMLKRYGDATRDQHPSSLSTETWERIRSMEWTDRHWRYLQEHIVSTYKSGEWFSSCGTQTNTVYADKAAILSKLGLDPAKKTAVVFPHIVWDSSYFWGEDLFENYETWLRATIRTLVTNSSVNWIIKVHPANVIKDWRDGITNQVVEERIIEEEVGEAPPHVAMLPANTDLSTEGILDMTDFCVTVRGTVGIEAAVRGIPVIIAGTGRYSDLGFTVDHPTRDAYLDTLKKLPAVPPLTDSQIELARRFAYGLFISRPTPISSVPFGFGQDGKGKLEVDINPDFLKAPYDAADVTAISNWVESGSDDFVRDETLSLDFVPPHT